MEIELKQKKDQLTKMLDDLKKSDNEMNIMFREKYGEGDINIETGMFTSK
jgi:hypothetical protein